MSDLIERLRTQAYSAPPEHPVHPAICDEAADRIEELEEKHAYLLRRLVELRFEVLHRPFTTEEMLFILKDRSK